MAEKVPDGTLWDNLGDLARWGRGAFVQKIMRFSAKQRLAASLDLSEVVGRLARISQKDEDWLAERGRNHSVVLRFF